MFMYDDPGHILRGGGGGVNYGGDICGGYEGDHSGTHCQLHTCHGQKNDDANSGTNQSNILWIKKQKITKHTQVQNKQWYAIFIQMVVKK